MTSLRDPPRKIALAAVQDSPVAFDLAASITKLQSLTRQASIQARSKSSEDLDVVVVFPEAFLSCYPRGYNVSYDTS
jgi:predicted amidohydrolase